MTTVPTLGFVDSTYREAVELTIEARDYFAVMDGHVRDQKLSQREMLLHSCEALRVTSRLTQIVAWLLVQRAVQNGEMSRGEASKPDHRLSGQKVCSEKTPAFEGALLPRLSELLESSLALYERIVRLDALYDQTRPDFGIFHK